MRKYGESKTTGIMMATVPHVTSGSGLSGQWIFVGQSVTVIRQITILTTRNPDGSHANRVQDVNENYEIMLGVK